MLKRGEQVQVWNRTGSKASALEAEGARAFAHVKDAVAGASRVHITLVDDETVDDILEQASAGFGPDTIIIDHTTTTVSGAVKRTGIWKGKGFTYLHAPVFMGPRNALDGTGHMLVSGDQEVIRRVEPALAAMTGQVVNLGAETGKAAATKLLGNSFLLFLTAGIADTLALGKAMGVTTSEAISFFEMWNPGTSLPARMKRMGDAKFDEPSWELKMARKDARLMMKEAGEDGIRLAFIPSIASEMDRWIETGHGSKDWMVIGKDSVI